MKHKKFIKLGLILIMISMIVSVIVNYYNNVLESENIFINEGKSTKLFKSKYETLITNPEFFFRDKNNREITFKAKSANKINYLINLTSILGHIKLNQNINFNFFADSAILKMDTKKIFLNGNIKANNNDKFEVLSNKILVDYDNYIISSDQSITINYLNMELKAFGFNFNNNNRILKFTDHVKVKIK